MARTFFDLTKSATRVTVRDFMQHEKASLRLQLEKKVSADIPVKLRLANR